MLFKIIYSIINIIKMIFMQYICNQMDIFIGQSLAIGHVFFIFICDPRLLITSE